MCGILGINEENESSITKVAKTFEYRGPDTYGVCVEGGVTFGHNRLAIIDLDQRAKQPMWNSQQTLCIVFNGEIYNFRKLRDRLLKEFGCSFTTESDTEVLLAAYSVWGKDLTQYLEGMYAFAVYDKSQSSILLFTDHVAIKPLFYYAQGGLFVFASELKGVLGLLKEKGINPIVDRESLSLYYALGYVPAPRTLYTDVHRLPQHTCVEYFLKTNVVVVTKIPEKKPTQITEVELQDLIEQKVKSHLVADVPVGLFFSGGTDSSLIAAILKKIGANLLAFSVRVTGRPEDAKYIEPIISELGLQAQVYDFGVAEFDEVYKDVLNRIDEPLYDSSLFPTYFVSKKAAQYVKVVLSGDGGDEFFFGYKRSLVVNQMREARIDFEVGLSERLFLSLPHFKGKNKMFEKWFCILKKPIAYYLLTMSPAKSLLSLSSWKRAKQVLATSDTPRALNSDWYLPNDLLRKLDLATMYNSIEGRVPLLDVDIVSAARGFAPPEKNTSEAKPILKRILATYLPKEYVYRKKSGFGISAQTLVSESRYLRSDLRDAIAFLHERELLLLNKTPDSEKVMIQNPGLGFSLLFLYYAIKNNEAMYE